MMSEILQILPLELVSRYYGNVTNVSMNGLHLRITESRREIFGARMDVFEENYRLMEEEETFDLTFLAEDDDYGEADGDENY